jgi:hypothetical protein
MQLALGFHSNWEKIGADGIDGLAVCSLSGLVGSFAGPPARTPVILGDIHGASGPSAVDIPQDDRGLLSASLSGPGPYWSTVGPL